MHLYWKGTANTAFTISHSPCRCVPELEHQPSPSQSPGMCHTELTIPPHLLLVPIWPSDTVHWLLDVHPPPIWPSDTVPGLRDVHPVPIWPSDTVPGLLDVHPVPIWPSDTVPGLVDAHTTLTGVWRCPNRNLAGKMEYRLCHISKRQRQA